MALVAFSAATVVVVVAVVADDAVVIDAPVIGTGADVGSSVSC